jgi:hypothetical protein
MPGNVKYVRNVNVKNVKNVTMTNANVKLKTRQ